MPELSVSIVHWPLMLAAAYLLGSIPFAQLIARAKGVDLRKVGSGNVGAGNLTFQFGKGWGALAALLDFAKGFVPVYLARKFGFGYGAAGLVGIASVVGHNWSIWMKGRSGRGLATSAGLLMAIHPVLIVWPLGWAMVGWKIGGGVGGFLGWGLLPFVSFALGQQLTLSLVLLLLAAILMGRRVQGNPDALWDRRSMLRRAVFDTDPHDQEFPETVKDPLTP